MAISSGRRLQILALAVFIDLFAVALVVPLLPIRMKELGVQPAMIGAVGSVYSAAQIVGGLVMGVLSDRILGRRSVLLISFAGAAFSYTMVGMATSVWMLLLSRVVVGLVKQTMTVSTAMAASWSEPKDRAAAMGAINSAVTVAWLSGSAVTTTLALMNPVLPTVLAVSLYGVAAVIVMATLPASDDPNKDSSSAAADKAPEKERAGFLASFRRAFANGAVARVLFVKLMYQIITGAGSSMNSFWAQERFGLNFAKLGMLNTVRAILSIVLQGVVVGRIIKAIGEQHALLVAFSLATVDSIFGATITNVTWFLALSTPTGALSGFLANIGLKSLFTQVVPQTEVGAALGVLDVLNSVCGVIAPLLGGIVLQYGGLVAKPIAEGIAYFGLSIVLWLGALPVLIPAKASKIE